jgi:tetratricopeptide (TPR) repeat protein
MRLLLIFFAALAFAQETAPIVPPTAPPTIPSLMTEGNAAYLKSDYEGARQAYLKAWELAQQTPREDPIRYDVLKRLVAIRAAAGEFADADTFLQMALNWKENQYGTNDLRLVDDLIQSVNLCRGMKDFERAMLVLNRVMGIHRSNGGTENAVYADDLSRMGLINMEKKNVPVAIVWFNQAISLRTKVAGPLDVSLINDLDRVAGAHIVMREYAGAEEAYRRALIIRETLLGKFDADLIATVDGLAYSLFGQKKFEEAEGLYKRLIGLWEKSVGEDHPMVAIALDKVATFYAEQKKFDQVKEADDRSIAIRAHFLAEGLGSAATEQIAEGNKDAAIAMYKRALLVMDPPSPLYDEMRTQMEEIVKGMTAPPPTKPLSKTPPRKSVPAKKQ